MSEIMTTPDFMTDIFVAPPASAPPTVFEPRKFNLEVGFKSKSLEKLITTAFTLGCSDIKIQSNDYVTVYYKRLWYAFNNRPLDESEANKCLGILAGASSVTMIGGAKPVDNAPEFFRHDRERSLIRLRLHARSARVGGCPNGVTITLRTIPEGLPNLHELGLPPALMDEILPKKGLVLMAGQTGHGKSTTIAGCLNERLKEDPSPSIITFEEPAEFAYDMAGFGRGPLVPQCDIGVHIENWAMAAKTAMRSKADIILMGEVRDTATADATTEMSITGHMVYATIHADTPNETVFRIVEFAPAGMRAASASKFLSSLRLLVAQKLIRAKQPDGSIQVIPIHSWLSFDSEMKDAMQHPDLPYDRWASYVKQQLKERGQDFASQAIPLIKAGRIGVDDLKEITMMGTVQAREFYEQHRGSGGRSNG